MTNLGGFSEDALRELELWPTLSLTGMVVRPGAGAALAQKPDAPARATPPTAAVAAPSAPRPAATVGGYRKKEPVPATPAALVIDPVRVAKIGGMNWDELHASAAECNACGLCKQRKQAVFGVGALQAPWLFVGEGPGADEDQQGEPFVGQAGKLLDAMLAAAGLQRGREVYIGNVVKCRPPGNRTPNADEAATCAPYLDRQIDLIQPRLIVALGKTAVTRLTGSEASMASLRGQVHQYRNIPVIATYHPAYLLRNLPDKIKAWEDLMLAKATFGAP